MAILSKKTDWVLEAAGYLARKTDREIVQCEAYAESLYETYVTEDPESNWNATDAVCEDMSYWGEC